MSIEQSSVFVAIVGRPNVGKSSLLNRLVGEKASIVTPKPQTTRTRITGILTRGPLQYVFIDTPGIHTPKNRLGKHMAKTVSNSLGEGDATLMLFEPLKPLQELEQQLAASLPQQNSIAVINKADTVSSPEKIDEKIKELQQLGAFSDVFVVSAHTGDGCELLLNHLAGRAVAGPHFFASDTFTDQPEKVLLAEIVREKLLIHLQQEIPHGTAVEVESFKERPNTDIIDIDVLIYCERKSHKGMVIGKGGAMLKTIVSQARQEAEQLLGARINMQCWVKVREGWRNNENMLNNIGFGKDK